MAKTYYSTPELAELLGVFHSTVRRWIEQDHVKGFRVGRNYKIPATEVQRMLDRHGLPMPTAMESHQSTKDYATEALPLKQKGRESVLRRLLVVDDICEPALVFRQGVILGTNKPFADLMGCDQIDLIGVSFDNVICGFSGDTVEQAGPRTHSAHLKTSEGERKEFTAKIDGIEGVADVLLMVVTEEE